jgi:hypothetical protein
MDWQPIETAPKDGTIVLLWAATEDQWDDYDCGDEPLRRGAQVGRASTMQPGLWWMTGGVLKELHSPTHWMPLPTPPRTEGGE